VISGCRVSEGNSEAGLPLPWCVSLAGTASATSVRLNKTEVIGAARYRAVRSADLHAIQHVKEIDPQFHVDPLPGIKALREGKILIRTEGTAQLCEVAGRVSGRESRVGEGAGTEDRFPSVVVVVVHDPGRLELTCGPNGHADAGHLFFTSITPCAIVIESEVLWINQHQSTP
jgi:hypothetical protein